MFALALLGCDAEEMEDTDGEIVDTDTDDGESSGEESGEFAVDCEEDPVVTYDTFGRGFLATYCNGCHAGAVVDRKGAPPMVVFDDRETVSIFAERILVRVLPPEGLTPMPPAGGVTEADLERLQIWLNCYP
jgi:hypothetical protein